MAFDNRADLTFDIITIISMALFTLEIFMNLAVKSEYFNSFFFYLDIISTLSLLLDMTIFSEAVGLSGNSAADTASLARAGRASKIGTKYQFLYSYTFL